MTERSPPRKDAAIKPLRIFGLVVAGFTAIAVLAAVALLLSVDPNRHRGAIEARVQQATGRPFAIAGTIKLELFPWLALDVGKVTIGNPEGFDAEPLLGAERARVGARLLPLLRGRLEVSHIAVDGLTVNLVRRADGHANWEGIGGVGSGGRQSVTAPASRPLEGLSIAGIDVSRATLTLRDESTRSLTRVRDFELHSGALGPASPVDLALGARIDAGEGTPATRIELRARATVDTARSLATLAALKLSGERIPAAAGSRPTPFAVTAPQLVLDWQVGTLSPATLELRFGDLALSVEVSGEQLFGARLVKGRVRLPEQPLRKLAPSLGLPLPATRDEHAFTSIAGTASFSLAEHSLKLEDLDCTLDRSHLRGRIAVADTAQPVIDLELHADAVDLDAYRAPAAAAAAAPAAAARPAARPLPLAALRAISAHGSVALDRATVAGLTLTELRVPFTAAGGDLRLKPGARAFGGTLTGDVHLDAAHEAATLALTADVRGIDIGAAVKAYAKSDRLSGRANVRAQLSGRGATDAALLDSLDGPMDVEVQNGALEGIDLTYELERAQALLQQQLPPARSGPTRTPFDVLSGHSQLAHGVLATDPLRLETRFLKVAGKGNFRLADQAVDYQITARVRELPAGGSSALASLQSLDIPVTVTGTVHDYQVRPDLAGLAKGRVRQELEKHKDELRNKLQDKLKGLFGN